MGYPTGMARPERGPQVREVGHGLQDRVEFTLAQPPAQSRFGLDQRLEFGHGVQVGEDLTGCAAEQVHQPGIEVRALPGPGHFDGSFGAACPMEHLDGVSEVEQPHQTRDVLTPDTVGDSLGIPAREDLPERVAHLGGEAEPSGQLSGGQAVQHQALFHRPASGQDQIGGQAKPVQERCPGPGMAECQPHQRQPGEIDAVTVAAERDVVAEPGRHFRGVGHAARPGQHHHVVQGHSRLSLQAQSLPQPYRNQPRPQYVLHWLAEPQIGGQRESGHDLSQPEPRVLITCFHTDHARRRTPRLDRVTGRNRPRLPVRQTRPFANAVLLQPPYRRDTPLTEAPAHSGAVGQARPGGNGDGVSGSAQSWVSARGNSR